MPVSVALKAKNTPSPDTIEHGKAVTLEAVPPTHIEHCQIAHYSRTNAA